MSGQDLTKTDAERADDAQAFIKALGIQPLPTVQSLSEAVTKHQECYDTIKDILKAIDYTQRSLPAANTKEGTLILFTWKAIQEMRTLVGQTPDPAAEEAPE